MCTLQHFLTAAAVASGSQAPGGYDLIVEKLDTYIDQFTGSERMNALWAARASLGSINLDGATIDAIRAEIDTRIRYGVR